MNQKKVVIISRNISNFLDLQKELKEAGMEPCTVTSIEDIIERYISLPFVLAIVDAESHGDETPKLVRYLYGAKPAPILVIKIKSCSCDCLELLRLGATVCMNMEASSAYQAAQAKALIQTYCARDDTLHRETLIFGSTLVINPVYRLVILDGEKINLTHREFDLLCLLARRNNKVFTPEEIYRQLWNDEDGTHIGDTVKSSIKALRKKLESSDHNYIQNVWGTGYQFVEKSDIE